jgi:hypothetical protein
MQRALVLAKYLEGVRSPALIAQALGTPDDESAIDAYLRSAQFNTHLVRANKDMATSVLDAIREQLHSFLAEYTDLGLNCGDPRVRAQVLKDLLDRGGTGATAKIALTTPDMYRKALEEYREPDEKVGGSDPDSDPPVPARVG